MDIEGHKQSRSTIEVFQRGTIYRVRSLTPSQLKSLKKIWKVHGKSPAKIFINVVNKTSSLKNYFDVRDGIVGEDKSIEVETFFQKQNCCPEVSEKISKKNIEHYN